MALKPDVEVYIEECVLHGFPAGDRHRIMEAVQSALEEMIAEHGVPVSWKESGDMPRVDSSFRISQPVGTEAIGSQIGQAIYNSFGKRSGPR